MRCRRSVYVDIFHVCLLPPISHRTYQFSDPYSSPKRSVLECKLTNEEKIPAFTSPVAQLYSIKLKIGRQFLLLPLLLTSAPFHDKLENFLSLSPPDQRLLLLVLLLLLHYGCVAVVFAYSVLCRGGVVCSTRSFFF